MDVQATVFVVEPDLCLRSQVAQALDGLGCPIRDFADEAEVLDLCRPESEGCLILGDRLRGISGLHLRQKLLSLGCYQPFIMISLRGNVEAAVEAMHEGALDYIEQPIARQRLTGRVQEGFAIDSAQRRRHAERASMGARIESLTARQQEVMRLVARGRLTKEIARLLALSPKTVEVHRSHIMKKMHVESTAELLHLLAKHFAQLFESDAVDMQCHRTLLDAASRWQD